MFRENLLKTCPLNPSHRIVAEKLSKHVTKCLRSSKIVDRRACPYDPMHIIGIDELEQHYEECASYQRKHPAIEEPEKCFSGVLTALEAQEQITQVFAELGTDGRNHEMHFIDGQTYEPVRVKISQPLYRSPLIDKPKSVKRKFRKQEVERFASIYERRQDELHRLLEETSHLPEIISFLYKHM